MSSVPMSGAVVSSPRIEALSRCPSVLRQVLGDDSREPRFIRTIARIGYTLLQTPIPLPGGGEEKESPRGCPPARRPGRQVHSAPLDRGAAPSAPEPSALAVTLGARAPDTQ